jgi:hypothetical protein
VLCPKKNSAGDNRAALEVGSSFKRREGVPDPMFELRLLLS